jgi:hypothetical protein
MKNTKKIMLPLLVAAVGFGLAACSDDEEGPIGSAGGNSQVMIVHASPDAPGVDILVDNAKALPNLSFPDNSGYVAVPAGTRNVKVNVANTSTTVIEADLTLDANTNYSVFAIDDVANIDALVVADDLSSPAAGKAHVRFIHLSPDAPPVDVAVTGGPVVFGDVQFSEVVGFTPLDAGTYDLEVRLAGTGTVVLSLPGISLSDGTIYTVFARGFAGGGAAGAADDLGAEIIVNR